MNNFGTQYYKILILTLVLIGAVSTVSAQRQMKTFNDGWKFVKEDVDRAAEKSFDDSKWQRISVPHTWNSDAYVDKDYYRGIAWYRKAFTISSDEKDKQFHLRFEGVNHTAIVFVNGQQVGEHKGGYTSFTFDITPYCHLGQSNVVAVKAENTLNDVPPISGDFTIFGGMYRDVWLISTAKVHVDMSDTGSDGIFVATDNVSEKSASYSIKGKIENSTSSKVTVRVTHTVRDSHNAIVKVLDEKLSIKGNETKDFLQTSTVNNPMLWSPETPNLYTVESVVSDHKSGQVIDIVNSSFGFRWFSIDEQKGFILNGKPYKLNGVCRHQDQMPIGNALSDEVHRRDMKLIKDMGANFVRVSHYPQDNAILEQCDRLGLLVWEEIPIIDIVPESTAFADNCETALREMIRQHYNHPSIVMWGYMNEILLVTQRKYNAEEQKPVVARSLELAHRLETVLKEEDNRRYSVMAFHGSESYNKLGFADITDIVGWNLYQGWYSDNMNQFEQFMKKQQVEYAHKPKIVSEYGAGSDRRIHSLKPKRFDFSIQYQQEYAEHYLSVIEREPHIIGATYWNFIDFGSAQRDESMPRINNKGLVYADRTPKDVYYLFKASFCKDIPVLHIASHDWQNRVGVSVNDNAVIQPLKVYSNLDEIELFMNGKSLGIKKCEGNKAVWDVPFIDGSHYFYTKGVFNGEVIEAGLDIKFTSVPQFLNDNNFENKELAINVGSDAFYTSPESNLTWLPDQEYIVGSWGYVGGSTQATVTQIIGSNDNPLLQTLRIEPEMYRLDVPDGDYEVELLFADIFKSSGGIAHNLGSENKNNSSDNVFDVLINGKVVEADLSVKDVSGYFFSIKKRYITRVENKRSLIIELKAKQGSAFVNGLKVRML